MLCAQTVAFLDGGTNPGSIYSPTTYFSSPVDLNLGGDWKHIYYAGSIGLGIKVDGSLWGWGTDSTGVILGQSGVVSTPIRIGTSSDWKHILLNRKNAFGLKTDGSLWSWGNDNAYGQLGLGHTSVATAPTLVSIGPWKTIDAQEYYSCTHGIKTDGSLWSWGTGAYGQLGLGDTVTRLVPTQVSGTYLDVISHANRTFVLREDHALMGFGKGANSGFGLGNNYDQLSPIRIAGTNTFKDLPNAALGSYCIHTNGTLWGWYFLQLATVDNDFTARQIDANVWKYMSKKVFGRHRFFIR